MVAGSKKHTEAAQRFLAWRRDWVAFASEVFGVTLDDEQAAILRSVQNNKMTSVASGTARGKDFISAVAALCFLYLTPVFRGDEMIENTKVFLTAPTSRQIGNIMVPEFTRLFLRATNKGVALPGKLTGYDIRTQYKEWFLTGFKSDAHQLENWTGLHASNIMFVITEASGISDSIFSAIEGNLQGESRILIVFNPNISTGYAAQSQKSPRWNKFRLDSLNAPNVLQRKMVIPGQVDYEWVADKVKTWCHIIKPEEFNEGEGDFHWEGFTYRPNDLFRVKVRGMFPKVSEDTLIPLSWVQLAQQRKKDFDRDGFPIVKNMRLGVDVAGMGRDSSCFCFRFGDYVSKFDMIQSGGVANHMEISGMTVVNMNQNTDAFIGKHPQAFIDTIGEGAGVYSRLIELGRKDVHSVKFSESADPGGTPLKDVTGIYEFVNMRAYLFWCVRDWLNPAHNSKAMLPEDDELVQELTEVKYRFRSDGKIQIEAKEDIKPRIGRSIDKFDALANTFYPVDDIDPNPKKKKKIGSMFH